MSKPAQLSTLVLDSVTVAAGALIELKQLTSLALHNVDIEDGNITFASVDTIAREILGEIIVSMRLEISSV